jgi:serine/threonine-protein kinase
MRLTAVVAAAGALSSAGFEPTQALAVTEELPIGTLAGEYQIEKKLGQGGMGAVYGARHPVIGKRAAIKVITRELSASAEAVERFVREAQAVNQIGHPNIVDVFGFGKLPDGRSFFVMEWLHGETLRERMQRALPLPDALEILEQIATALQAAHDAGVLHRDLKPDNVFLQEQKGASSKVKLLDFGLAKLQGGGDGGRMDRTRTGVVMGTPLYISPEQAKGIKVDFAADIYSLGAIAYEMCAGKVPFIADSAVEIMAKHISEPVRPMFQIAPHTPPMLDSLVLSMLDKDPQQRPVVAKVHEELAAVRAQVASKPSTTLAPLQQTQMPVGTLAPEEVAPRKSKRGLVIAIVGAAVVAAGAVAVLLFIGDEDKHPKAKAPEIAIAADPPPQQVAPQPTEPPAPPPKPEPVKTEPPKTEPPKTEPPKTEPPKTEPPKTEPPKTEPPKKQPTAPAVPPDKQTGAVTVKLEGVQHGRIWVDGKMIGVGVTEAEIDLPPGDHKVHAESPGHQPANDTIHVAASKHQTVKLVMKPRRSGNGVYDPFDNP